MKCELHTVLHFIISYTISLSLREGVEPTSRPFHKKGSHIQKQYPFRHPRKVSLRRKEGRVWEGCFPRKHLELILLDHPTNLQLDTCKLFGKSDTRSLKEWAHDQVWVDGYQVVLIVDSQRRLNTKIVEDEIHLSRTYKGRLTWTVRSKTSISNGTFESGDDSSSFLSLKIVQVEREHSCLHGWRVQKCTTPTLIFNGND